MPVATKKNWKRKSATAKRMNRTNAWAACLLLLALVGCRASRVQKSVGTAGVADSALVRMQQNYFRYDWFSAHAKITLVSGDDKTEVGANVKAKKDSAIWI